ncbi:ribonucleotide-diphosphate reductase subunit beta [Enhygromyxa salina]|uniref:Ribonucleotide-diphosphate reductase subunit beta n=1 Tax=Enhygromyxa salina TaxID=215803 RepID=A0A2S9XDV8_9BACT|nr:ferritin-like domain-containing protein [Enhygromyxa salina]PRP91046.1 ribonucleotide-diphosphate reductase subunit beta [Enhygromyxa salina]
MLDSERLTNLLPTRMRSQVDSYFEALSVFMEIRDPKVLRSLAPSGVRGMLLQRGKQGEPTKISCNYEAHFDWTYPADQPEMAELYRRAKQGQWDSDSLAWNTDVDPFDYENPLLPDDFLDPHTLAAELGTTFTNKELAEFRFSLVCWLLSQFLHGEQGALFAACQVTEAVQFFDGKLYGATQVMDEGRHVEVFNRYLDQKLGRLYQINDNLFVIIDSLMTDSRWDMKFLGMQIMVEGLALGAFGVIYKVTREPLLRALLEMVIQDEARHVHYGVLALREHITKELSERERQEREDWAFEVALLMRNRFMVYEVYEEWFEGLMTREHWRRFISNAPGMKMFRQVMFSRLVPNLRAIGLMSERILPYYEKVGLLQYFDGVAADGLTAEQMLRELDGAVQY